MHRPEDWSVALGVLLVLAVQIVVGQVADEEAPKSKTTSVARVSESAGSNGIRCYPAGIVLHRSD